MLAMSPIAARSPEDGPLLADLTALQGWEVNAWKGRLRMSTSPFPPGALSQRRHTLTHDS